VVIKHGLKKLHEQETSERRDLSMVWVESQESKNEVKARVDA
jgi:hypothetical protein